MGLVSLAKTSIMAATLYYKVTCARRGYIASFKYAEDAAAFVAFLGEGAKIRNRYGLVLWHEGAESVPALESYDFVALRCAERDDGVLNPQNMRARDREDHRSLGQYAAPTE